jgi:molybdopterin-guanine dinucleotide biosynthesis protein MobB
LATPTDIAMFRDNENSVSLDEIVLALGATDIVLVEGFHEEARAKIEVLADRMDEPLCKMDSSLLAVVTPIARETKVPTFEPTNIKPLADLIEREILGNPGFSGVTQNSNVEIPSVSQLPGR